MGKFLDKFNHATQKTKDVAINSAKGIERKYAAGDFNKKRIDDPRYKEDKDTIDMYDDFEDDFIRGNNDEVGVTPAQKPESFFHFILENQYKDLERSIRGVKDVFDKDTQRWVIKRKQKHCFTDEEAEDILRTAQSHLSTDIKLGWIKLETFGEYMQTLYDEISFLFESIAEYRYGRYGSYQDQYEMKLQNHKIFLELWTRIQANYSRSINGQENKYTHDSVKSQESLQGTEKDWTGKPSSYT